MIIAKWDWNAPIVIATTYIFFFGVEQYFLLLFTSVRQVIHLPIYKLDIRLVRFEVGGHSSRASKFRRGHARPNPWFYRPRRCNPSFLWVLVTNSQEIKFPLGLLKVNLTHGIISFLHLSSCIVHLNSGKCAFPQFPSTIQLCLCAHTFLETAAEKSANLLELENLPGLRKFHCACWRCSTSLF